MARRAVSESAKPVRVAISATNVEAIVEVEDGLVVMSMPTMLGKLRIGLDAEQAVELANAIYTAAKESDRPGR